MRLSAGEKEAHPTPALLTTATHNSPTHARAHPQPPTDHVYRTGGDAHNCLPGHDGAVVSGHYFSKDGFTWHASAVAPYGNVVNLTDGTAQLLTTRERPKMLFNAQGVPTHLSNGVCPSPGGWSTPIACPEVSCVDCKYADWDFTNVSPLAL